MVRRLLHAFICSCLWFCGFAQENNKVATHSLSTQFTVSKKYLVLPVKNGAPKRNLELWVDGVNTRFFDMELAEGKADWYAYLQIGQWKDKQVELRVDKITTGSSVFSPVLQSDADTNAGMVHKEKLRPQFHFSPTRGWTNDPNGMVYFNGAYHLFYQHNPYGRGWGNMTWGHAVSKDLVHWKDMDDALHPDPSGPVFSGGAVVDSNNTSGLGTPGKPAMVMFHTGARGWGQYMSWTTDGVNFHTLDHAVVPRINKDNRDPKVIWYAPANKWVMVFWVERGENEQHSMQFLSSPDLINWTKTSSINGGIGNDRYLFECPEFYELAVEGSNEKKWILTGANTQYAIGSFDGNTFIPEAQRLQGQFGRDYYAPQTFSNEPTGRRIEIGWWRTNTDRDDMVFNQSMSLPMEHKLVNTADGPRLTRTPVKELEGLRSKSYKFGKLSVKENGGNLLKGISTALTELRMELEPGKASEIKIDVRGVAVVYDAISKTLVVDGVKAPVALMNGKLDLIIYADRTGLEIFANKGLVYMPVNINLTEANHSLALTVKGGTVKFTNLDVYELKSIWDEQ